MRDGDDHDFLLVDRVNDVVSKLAQSELADARRQRLAGERVRQQKRNGVAELLFEPIAQAVALRVEIGDRFRRLFLGRFEEPRAHYRFRARNRAKTSSAGADSMRPALYSAMRRSPSAAQS